jgi:predicted  nucleic acid-binding Zn-ribbon protein
MSGNELTMDEKYFDLQNKLIETKLSAIANTLETFGRDVKKVLDDHETRLREQAKITTVNAQEIVTQNTLNAQEISGLRSEQRELKQEIESLRREAKERVDYLNREREEHSKVELKLWQTIAVEAIKYAAFGASGGGVAVLIIKLFGITI